MAATCSAWTPIYSNPDVFNRLLSELGVSSVETVDVFSFDDEMLQDIPTPQVALILCFPDYKAMGDMMAPVYEKMKAEGATVPSDVFFMQQRIANACGTFALIHSLANSEDKIDLGKGALHEWLEKARDGTAESRSDLMESSAAIAAAHEAAARVGGAHPVDDVSHHFIAFVLVKDDLYELDSFAPFPRLIGQSSGEHLVRDASKHIKEGLMTKLDSISFSALALVAKRA